MTVASEPVVIQGGMGVYVSSWPLARQVSLAGQLGVVSGTGLDTVLARELQDGDPGGHRRRALAHFPVPAVAERILTRYYRALGRGGAAYRPNPTVTLTPGRDFVDLAVAGNFTEVWLAKEGHDGMVGVNFLEKVQMCTPTAVLGVMAAGVDYVLMGAGIPREIPQLLRDLEAGRPGGVTVDVIGETRRHTTTVDPATALGAPLPPLTRPKFLAIVSVHSLASYLYRDERIRPDGFVVEGPVAGGHSAPPRGRLQLDEHGDPIYGPKDLADLGKMAEVGLPFWLAGAYGTPEQVAEALAAGAAGVQSGTIFALAQESGLREDLKARMLDSLRAGELVVRNDPRASPTGFPFKVAEVAGTLSEPDRYAARDRICDLSYLRSAFERPDGTVGYRCAAEPASAFLRKGGAEEDLAGRKCLCNALMANVGFGQTRRDGYVEEPALTLGSDVTGAAPLLAEHAEGWTAQEAVEWLLSAVPDGRSTSGRAAVAAR